ncbi:hypothetical protein Ddye_019573 [Dipteronia dyeriana]|uniref:Protein kinase domain-containing protein n=1 Tax=Dipteronia dyeriana TaxID=168575 RepID=A0AAD9TZ26_9ROSI|nr:hypothetical protein Ddye_019573 [Dipteronia dyeriana]
MKGLIRVGFRRKSKTHSGYGWAVNEITTVESLQFGFGTIQAATNGFSTNNKLCEGGFGEVYKGVLPNRQDIAVKRLPRSSGQDVEEFKNDVELVAKFQHRNLIRLLGFCLEGQEKILVHEFVPNISLDQFLYGLETLERWNTNAIVGFEFDRFLLKQ